MLQQMNQWMLSEGIEAVDKFEGALDELGLEYRRLPLKKYNNCVHWHISMPKSSGTLEATYLGDTQRLWLEVRTGRSAAWQVAAIAELESRFK